MSTFTKLATASFTALVCFGSTAAFSAKCDAYSFASRTYADALGIKNDLNDEGRKGTAPFCKAAALAIESAARALQELRANPSCAGPSTKKLWASRSDAFETEMDKQLYGC
jgi:hypothetical protein